MTRGNFNSGESTPLLLKIKFANKTENPNFLKAKVAMGEFELKFRGKLIDEKSKQPKKDSNNKSLELFG